jgi:hypothetical protein
LHENLTRFQWCLFIEPKESTPISAPTAASIVWDDDDEDFQDLLSQFPVDLPSEKSIHSQNSLLLTTPTMDDDMTRLDETRRSSAILTRENQSFVYNTTRIELSSQPHFNVDRTSTTSLQRSSTGPLSPRVTNMIFKDIQLPRVRCDSNSVIIKKGPCTEAEIEQKRLAALAIRRQREEERQKRAM